MPTAPYAYIFGYGSLLESKSRASTVPDVKAAYPALVWGIQRGWFDQAPAPGYAPTYLGAVLAPNVLCNGVIFPVTQEEFEAYNKRETGYKASDLNKKDNDGKYIFDMQILCDLARPTEPIYFYESQSQPKASAEYPIVQSYVDVCVTGCLEMEKQFPDARKIKVGDSFFTFSELFVHTTEWWNEWWVNDRLIPRRPWLYSPNAYTIDTILNKAPRTKDLYPKVPLSPASWERRAL